LGIWGVGSNGTSWRFNLGRWIQTPASGMGDVAVGPHAEVWLAGENGTIGCTKNLGKDFTQFEGSGFSRVSVGPDNMAWGVGSNGTLWKFVNGQWTKTPASGMGDVAVGPDGKVWLAGKNGTIWFTINGIDFTQVEG